MTEESHKNKLSRKKKRRNDQIAESEAVPENKVYVEYASGEENLEGNRARDNKNRKLGKKKKKNEKKAGVNGSDHGAEDNPELQDGTNCKLS